jgi:hypothetical protein
MNRPILRAGVIVGVLGLGMTGCQQAQKTDTASKTKPTDPSAWSDKDLSKDDSGSGSSSSSLPRSSRLPGGLSSEAQAVEASLGVGSR